MPLSVAHLVRATGRSKRRWSAALCSLTVRLAELTLIAEKRMSAAVDKDAKPHGRLSADSAPSAPAG